MCNSSLTTLASLSPCSKTLKAVTFILKLRPIHTTDTFFQVSEICRPDVTVPSVPVCRSPDSESPITPSYDISQIINTFVMLYLHLNVIFSITHPEVYYNTLLSVVKLRYYLCVCGVLNIAGQIFPPCPRFSKKHCSKCERKKKGSRCAAPWDFTIFGNCKHR